MCVVTGKKRGSRSTVLQAFARHATALGRYCVGGEEPARKASWLNLHLEPSLP